jgi:tRNA G18 (ribose-2'-O)-methylase SpoU
LHHAGGEEKGYRHPIQKQLMNDFHPVAGEFDSLNVSVATGTFCAKL